MQTDEGPFELTGHEPDAASGAILEEPTIMKATDAELRLDHELAAVQASVQVDVIPVVAGLAVRSVHHAITTDAGLARHLHTRSAAHLAGLFTIGTCDPSSIPLAFIALLGILNDPITTEGPLIA